MDTPVHVHLIEEAPQLTVGVIAIDATKRLIAIVW
jgi:hypothetical protein